MKGNKIWIDEGKKTITRTKLALGSLVADTRTQQFKTFEKFLKPTKYSKVLDVGVSSEEVIGGTNMFDKLYKYPNKLTLATIEDSKKINKIYPASKVVRIKPDKNLPFKDKSFDIAVSWATLEHVGNRKKQEIFLNELQRVSKKTFVTTPYRACIYEPHSGFLFAHWLPLKAFRFLCKITGKGFWSDVENLNPLYVRDIERMHLSKKPIIIIYKMFGLIPSHLLIMSNK